MWKSAPSANLSMIVGSHCREVLIYMSTKNNSMLNRFCLTNALFVSVLSLPLVTMWTISVCGNALWQKQKPCYICLVWKGFPQFTLVEVRSEKYMYNKLKLNKLASVFYLSVLLLMINCIITLSNWLWNHKPQVSGSAVN